MKIPLYVPWISQKDKKTILDSLKSPQLTDGPRLREFESRFKKLVKCKFAIGVSNGTSALHLALKSLGIKKDDEVIVPDLTFIATANAVLHCGAKPVLADIDSTLNLSLESVKSKITKRTKAIIPVHFGGSVCDIIGLRKIAIKNNLKLVEDCAHALGASFNKKQVGTFGNAGCFSFYPTKNITTIEGGMITTNSKKIAQTITKLRSHGITKSLMDRHMKTKPWSYDVEDFGYNFRLDEVRSSLGISQLERFSVLTSKRTKAADYYNKKLENIEGIEIPPAYAGKNHVYHLYIIKIKNGFGASRDDVHLKLIKKGIFTTVHYKPIHKFSFFKKFHLNDKNFPNTMKAFNECLTLPLYPTISRKKQDYVISNLLKLRK